MDLSFREKSLWLMLTSLVVAFSLYFASALPAQSQNVLPHQIVTFAALIVLLVVFQVFGHAVLAVLDRRHGSDERDRLIRLKGSRNGAYVLAAGVFASICLALWIEGNFFFTHVLLAFWVVAQLVEIASQLVLYRRGT